MKLERCALVAEIVGSIAVVVTLAILILEVRENTDESRASNRQSVISDLREQLLVRAQSPSLAAALAAAEGGTFDPASPLPHKAAFAPFATTYLNSAS